MNIFGLFFGIKKVIYGWMHEGESMKREFQVELFLKKQENKDLFPRWNCVRYCHAVWLICVCDTTLWSVNPRTECSSSLTQHPHKNTHCSSKLAWAFTHTHFITPLQGLIHSQANAKKSIYYLPLHNSPGRFILMPPACISFPFFCCCC